MKPSEKTIGIFFFVFILCLGLATGCSKKDDDLFIPPNIGGEEVEEFNGWIALPNTNPMVYTGDVVTFESSVVGGYEPYTFSWDFDGDGKEDSDVQNPGDIQYNDMGVFTVTLKVKDARGNGRETNRVVRVVEDLEPTARIDTPTANRTVDSGTQIAFSSTGSGGNGTLSFSWDFGGAGDGLAPEILSSEDPGNVLFTNMGNLIVSYTVILTVTDANGDEATDSVIISVRPYAPYVDTVPVPSIISPEPNSGNEVHINVGDTLEFMGAVALGNPPFNYNWSFPGGSPVFSTEIGPVSVTYNTSASYSVNFTVRDRDGDVRHASLSIRVFPRTITMPDLEGMNLYEASSLIEDNYLNVGIVSCEYSDTVAVFDVISQSPADGSSVTSGSTVNLTISLGAADENAYWSQKGALVNLYMEDIGVWFANNGHPIETGLTITGYTEYVLDQTDPVYISTWDNSEFATVPGITLENVKLYVEESSIPFTTEGAVFGDGTLENTRFVIQSGTYAGTWFSKGAFELSGYTCSVYGFGSIGSAQWHGIMEGDIHGLYIHNGTEGVLYITSVGGVQTNGFILFDMGDSTVAGSVMYEDLELLIQEGIVWSGSLSGYIGGDFEYAGVNLYVPMYRVGRYSGLSAADDQINSYLSFNNADQPLEVDIMVPSSEQVTVTQGEPVVFKGYISGNNGPYAITWDYDGDGETDAEGILQGEWIYDTPSVDPYIAAFRVVDSEGIEVTDTVEITVEEANTTPEAAILSPSEGMAFFQGSTIDFEASVTGGNEPVTYVWDFNGDGSPDADTLTASYAFNTADDYIVTFTATDRDGDQDVKTVLILVRPVQVTPDLVGLPFQDAVSAISAESLTVGACYVEYSTDFGAGQIISQTPPSGTQVFPGTDVELIVSLGAAVPDSAWTQIGLTTGSFPYYVPPVNAPVSIVDTQHPDPFATNDVCNSTLEYLPSLVEGDNHAAWTGIFSSVPTIQWIDPVTNAEVTLWQRTGLTGTVTDTSGLIQGNVTASDTSYTIQSGLYAGHRNSRIVWEIAGYTGTIYAVGNSSSGDLFGQVYPGEFWGRVVGDVTGMYRTISENHAEIYITSIGDVQASGTLSITWNTGGYTENITPYSNVPVYVQEGISWSGQGSGCVTGEITHSGTSIYLPVFNVGQYIGTWFYYESDPNNYDQSGYIRTYIEKSN